MEELPNEIENIIKDYLIFKPKNREKLKELWIYGVIIRRSN